MVRHAMVTGPTGDGRDGIVFGQLAVCTATRSTAHQ